MFSAIYYWIDLIWVPILFFGVHKVHRWWALGFVIACMILVRLLSEFMTHIGYPYGIMGILEAHVHTRALVVSSFFYSFFLIIAHFSSKTEGIVFLAAALSIFFMIFLVGSLTMLL